MHGPWRRRPGTGRGSAAPFRESGLPAAALASIHELRSRRREAVPAVRLQELRWSAPQVRAASHPRHEQLPGRTPNSTRVKTPPRRPATSTALLHVTAAPHTSASANGANRPSEARDHARGPTVIRDTVL